MAKVGRPKQEIKRTIEIKIKVTEDELKKINDLAEGMKMNRSRLIRNMILGNIDDVKFMQKIGLLPLVQNINAFQDKFRGFDYWEDIKKEEP